MPAKKNKVKKGPLYAMFTFFVDSAFAITLRTSSTLFKRVQHFSLLSFANFNALMCLKATFLFPEFKEAKADFLDLKKDGTFNSNPNKPHVRIMHVSQTLVSTSQ